MAFTLEELEAEAKRRAEEKAKQQSSGFSASEAAKAFAYGAQSAGIDLTTLPFLPSDIVQSVMGQKSMGSKVREGLGQADEAQFPGYENYFRAGQGFTAGAPFGAPGGPIGMGVAGAGGAIANIIGKELFPESPTAQALLGLAAPGGVGVARSRAAGMPEGQGVKTDIDTGIPMTFGQRTGKPESLMEEARVRTTLKGAPIASAFDAAQARSVDDFFSNIQRFTANAQLSPKQVSDGLYEAFDKFTGTAVNRYKATNKAAFNNAFKVSGDSKIISPSTTIQRIDELLNQYSRLDQNTVPDAAKIVDGLNNLKSQFQSGFSVREIQSVLEDFGTAVYGKSTAPGRTSAVFAGVTPGSEKGIYKYILGGLRDDLNTTANSNIRGAVELKQARDGVVRGLKELEDIASKPLVKYFNTASPEALVPEKVISDFFKLPPTQKAEAAAVLQQSRPDLWESLRAQGFSQVLEKSRIGSAAAAGQPKFDLKIALKEIGNLADSPNFSWLFPTQAEQNLYKAGLQNLQSIQQKTKFVDLSSMETREALRALQEGAGAFAGAKGKYGTQFIIDTVRAVIGNADDAKIASMLFTPDGRSFFRQLAKPQPSVTALQNFMQKYPQYFAFGTAGSAVTATEVPTPSQRVATPMENVFELNALEDEARRRGLIK